VQQVEAALAADPGSPATNVVSAVAEPTHAAVERARAFLAARFAENDSLAAIGQAAACSPYQLARLFRRHTGRSLHGHRTALRLAEALRRLEQGEAHLGHLAADLGFASHSHFSAVCRAVLGRSPAAMRTILTARRAR
jgi:AraC-like DNA-binding protein